MLREGRPRAGAPLATSGPARRSRHLFGAGGPYKSILPKGGTRLASLSKRGVSCSHAVDAGAYPVHTGDAGLPPILVVDDNHDNAEIIRQYLEIRGYPITVAHNGDEALAVYETVRPAVVLLDVMMPGRDGWEVCRIMKQHPTLGKNVRIIMVTALDAWDDKREALQLGADDYVEKPFDLPTLAKTVQRNLAQMRAAS
ncbi:MAG: hypothetical protein DMD35_12930 [Gemmatimonadetes bacterium]|nr:MAG: hypothetical protein DMD35_12930 [Gemmatimonadota bacterium]